MGKRSGRAAYNPADGSEGAPAILVTTLCLQREDAAGDPKMTAGLLAIIINPHVLHLVKRELCALVGYLRQGWRWPVFGFHGARQLSPAVTYRST
jgi:hypothetical protein